MATMTKITTNLIKIMCLTTQEMLRLINSYNGSNNPILQYSNLITQRINHIVLLSVTPGHSFI